VADAPRRLHTVAEALAHVEAPAAVVAWARPFELDFERAWRECPRASWLAHLGLTARMPFEPLLAGIAAAHALRPRDPDIHELAALGVTIKDPEDVPLAILQELAASAEFQREQRVNLGYGDGFVEQAFCSAAHDLEALEEALGVDVVLGAVRAQANVGAFMRAYRRCVDEGYAGLEIYQGEI
jgi:hypothetical protein